jgi:uncharacterized BrkB/YihY/UPF0761 family membrane protein
VGRARHQVDEAYERLQDSRSRVQTIDVAFTFQENDRDAGGSLLGGAIAFRLFLWLLPLALLVIAGLGFSSAQSTTGPSGLVRDAGITSIAADSINQAAQDSASTRWVALILGAFFLYTTSVALMKALFVAHALIWQVPVPRIAHKPRAVGELLLAIVLLLLSSCVASVVRDHSPGYGLVLMLADTLMYAVIWWGFSSRLPHGAASLLELLPGAVLFSLGAQVLHLVAVYYLAARLTRASVLYGSLGIAAAILFGLYLVGRLIVASAVLNAGLFMRQHPAADPSGDPLSGHSAASPLAGDQTRPPKPLIGGSSGEP